MPRSTSDDELWAVQGRWLGPPGKTLPWQARYSAYVLAAVFFLIALIVRTQLRILPGGGGYVVAFMAALVATALTMRLVGPERPVLAVLAMLLAEISAPRPGAGKPVREALSPASIPMAAARPRPAATRTRKRGRSA